MGLFRQHRDHDDSGPPAPDAAGRIGYDAELVDSLLRDHAELGRIWRRIGAVARAGRFADVTRLLVGFRSRLECHLLTENLHFYQYVEQSLAESDDPGNVRMVREFRHEMNDIARDVVAFLKHYQSVDFTDDDAAQTFARDYAAVGERLAHRLDCEEDSLFRLYRPH